MAHGKIYKIMTGTILQIICVYGTIRTRSVSKARVSLNPRSALHIWGSRLDLSGNYS